MIAQQAERVRRQSVARRAWDWIIRHEAVPKPYDGGLSSRIAFSITLVMALAYAVILTLYMIGRNNTFATHAEELGIMDQVLWNNLHGHFMMQTICNAVTDVNCLGDISRFAIHFEPILIPLSLLYIVWPSVNALFTLQAAVVASGVIPIWLLATRRLRNPWWGIAFAAMFLAYPPMIAALTDDFHPETLAATILLWTLYFLMVRRYRAMVICLGLALLCKETMTLDVMGIGVFMALIHRRWWLGLGIIILSALTLTLALGLMHFLSPLGHSPVSGRLDGLLHAPIATALAIVRDSARRSYLIKLLAPVGFLPLLSPWVAALAFPSVALNLLSSDAAMHSGKYQYNTDIAAVLVVAAIDAMVWLAPLARRWFDVARARILRTGAPRWLVASARPQIAIVVVAALALLVGLGPQAPHIYQRVTVTHIVPTLTAHQRLGRAIAATIPPHVSVSAQSTLVPHVSHRAAIYQFPSGVASANYVFVDVDGGDFYPFTSRASYVNAVSHVLASNEFTVITDDDGYLLLRRASSSRVLPATSPPQSGNAEEPE